MKTQEQRIADGAAEIERLLKAGYTHWPLIFQEAMVAADREVPRWPSDESVNEYHDAYLEEFGRPPCGVFEQERAVLRSALIADPIIQAAIGLHNASRSGKVYSLAGHAAQIIRAVTVAGLDSGDEHPLAPGAGHGTPASRAA